MDRNLMKAWNTCYCAFSLARYAFLLRLIFRWLMLSSVSHSSVRLCLRICPQRMTRRSVEGYILLTPKWYVFSYWWWLTGLKRSALSDWSSHCRINHRRLPQRLTIWLLGVFRYAIFAFKSTIFSQFWWRLTKFTQVCWPSWARHWLG